MRFNYSHSGHSPELIVPAVVGDFESPLILDFDAKIDTGADITIVPSKVRAAMKMMPTLWTFSSGALGQKWTRVPLFYVRMRIAGSDWMDVRVTESSNNYILLGRDILNQYVLTAHGPEGWFQLDLPAKA